MKFQEFWIAKQIQYLIQMDSLNIKRDALNNLITIRMNLHMSISIINIEIQII